MKTRDALFVMNLLPEIGPLRVRQLQEHFPHIEEALGASVDELLTIPRMTQRCAQVLHDWENHCDAAREETLCRQNGIYAVTWADEAYPKRLLAIHDPPLCLYVRGSLEGLNSNRNALALVGSRNMTPYGAKMASAIAAAAVKAGWVVVSGLARGVDTAAHSAVVENRGCTVGVLGSGMLRFYPQENIHLAAKMVETGGAIVTEYPLDEGPDRRHFPMRNRVIAGMCRGCVVVEAGLHSGSLITAAQTIEQGKTVFAVPGNADKPFSMGCHALIRDGARLLESFNDVLEEFELTPPEAERALRRNESECAQSVSEMVPVSQDEWMVWQAIGEGGCSVDDVVEKLDVPASAVLGTLLLLEMKQLIRQLPGQRLERTMTKSPRPEKNS